MEDIAACSIETIGPLPFSSLRDLQRLVMNAISPMADKITSHDNDIVCTNMENVDYTYT